MSEKSAEEVKQMAQERIRQRQGSDSDTPTVNPAQQVVDETAPWRFAFVSMIGVLLLGLLLAPGFSLDQKMYIVLHGMCSQQHNIALGNIQFPICARCTGIYVSTLTTMLYFWALGRGLAGRVAPWPIVGAMIAFVLLMAADGFNSMATELGVGQLYEPRNDIRIFTGIGLGIGIGVLLLMMINTVLRRNPNDTLPAFKNWLEFGGAWAINLLVLVAVYGNLHFMAWPLAIMAFLGMVGVIYVVNLILVSLIMGYDGSVTRLSQLAKPATLAIIPTLIMLWATSALRYWLEAQEMMPHV